MVVHSVNTNDLQTALASARSEAALILDQVNFVQAELKNTDFVGEQAELLAEEMNTKMQQFVTATYDNVDWVLRLIVDRMNIVVTKLGGQPWPHETVARGSAGNAETLRIAANSDYQIDLDKMSTFANQVDGWFETIATSYGNIRGAVADGTPGWQGPEKITTVTDVNSAIAEIVGSAGATEGSGVRGVGASLSGRLRDQVTLMEST